VAPGWQAGRKVEEIFPVARDFLFPPGPLRSRRQEASFSTN